MVSIMLLTIAIVPMVAMFDVGLRSATTSSNYDKARAFVNERLELVKTLPYASARDSFPVSPSTPVTTGPDQGIYSSPSPVPVPTSAGLPTGSTYTVRKQYVRVPAGASSSLAPSGTDSRMMRVTVTVSYDGKTVKTSGDVSGGLT